AGGRVLGEDVRDFLPGDPICGLDEYLEDPFGEVTPALGTEAVEASVREILGEEDGLHLWHGRGGLVTEDAHCAPGDCRSCAGRIALPHPSLVDLLAGQPGAPGRGAARAVEMRPIQDAARVGDLSGGREAHHAHATASVPHLAVGDVDP